VVKKRKGSYSSSPEAPRGDSDMGLRRVFVKKDDSKRREEEKVKNGESKVKSRSHSESEVSLFLPFCVCVREREKVCVFAVIALTHKIPCRRKGKRLDLSLPLPIHYHLANVSIRAAGLLIQGRQSLNAEDSNTGLNKY
jgi:hypothetical protein